MRRLTNINPVSLVESVARLEADGTRAAVVGGGTDLLGMLKLILFKLLTHTVEQLLELLKLT